MQHVHERAGDNTSPEFRICVYHREHTTKIERTEKDVDAVWHAINVMRGWVIAGCGAMILCLIGIITQITLK